MAVFPFRFSDLRLIPLRLFSRVTLRAKVLLVTAGVFLAGLLFLLTALTWTLRRHQYEELEGRTAAQATLLRQLYRPLLQRNPSPQELHRITGEFGNLIRGRVRIVGTDGRVVAGDRREPLDAPGNASPVAEIFGAPRERNHGYLRTMQPGWMTLTMPLAWRDEYSLALQVSVPLERIERRIRHSTRLMAAFLTLLMGIALALQHALIGSATRPLKRMSQTARRIADGGLHQRVGIRRGDEVGELARAFNQMTRSLDQRIGHLREAETTMRTAFAHMADGVVVLDVGGRVLLFNSVAEETFGVNAGQAQGRTLLDIALHPELDALVSQALRAGVQGTGEIQLRRPAPRILRVYVTPIPGEESAFLGAVLVFQDLTEIRRLESVRRDFVTNASHELKTPLATIRVMVDTLKTGLADDPETAQRFLNTIGGEVQRLGALVDDLLDLSKIETGHLRTEFEVISLEAIFRSLVETYGPQAAQRSQALEAAIECDSLVWADPHALIRIGSNLIENAMKYTPDGGRIEVGCGREGREAFFYVKDDGVGIPEAELARIFERFYRVDKARSRVTGGTGLGLSIVKHLVEAHHGRIEVESAPGRGSRFTVRLPAILEEEWAEESGSEEDASPVAELADPGAEGEAPAG